MNLELVTQQPPCLIKDLNQIANILSRLSVKDIFNFIESSNTLLARKVTVLNAVLQQREEIVCQSNSETTLLINHVQLLNNKWSFPYLGRLKKLTYNGPPFPLETVLQIVENSKVRNLTLLLTNNTDDADLLKKIATVAGEGLESLSIITRTSDVAKPFITNSPNLKQLFFFSLESPNTKSDAIAKEIAQTCRGLAHLNFKGLLTQDSFLEIVQNNRHLTRLELTSAQLLNEETVQQSVKWCPHLEIIRIEHWKGSTTILLNTPHHPLKQFTLYESEFTTSEAIQNLTENAPSLEVLHLSYCKSLKGKLATTSCPKMRELRLNSCQELNPEDIVATIHNFPNLEILTILESKKLNSSAISTITSHSPNLTTLLLQNCPELQEPLVTVRNTSIEILHFGLISPPSKMSWEALIETARNCPNLKKLAVNQNSQVTSETIKTIFISCPHLRSFALGDHKDMKEITIDHSLPDLEEIWLGGSRLTHFTLNKECPNLKELHLPNSKQTTLSLGNHCPQLEKLTLGACPPIEELEKIVSNTPRLKSLSIHQAQLCSFPEEKKTALRQFAANLQIKLII